MARPKLYPDEEVVRVTLRLPIKLKEKIEQMAVVDHRSLTQEIVALVEEAVQRREQQRLQAAKPTIPQE